MARGADTRSDRRRRVARSRLDADYAHGYGVDSPYLLQVAHTQLELGGGGPTLSENYKQDEMWSTRLNRPVKNRIPEDA